MSKERTAPEATTKHRYPIPNNRMEWSSERRNIIEIHVPEPQWLRPGPNSDNDVEPAPTDPPELPTPQREGLKLTDRARGYEYTLKTHIVPAAWPRSTPDVGYPAGCGVDGLQERRGSARVREEMLKVKKKYMKGELPGGRTRGSIGCA